MQEDQPTRIGRRLAAIVAADVAGYSRLMGLDEVGTARTLREHRAVTDALVAKHGGRLVKSTGDGVLLEFPSVVDAVECAVAVQAVMAQRNEGVPADRQMLFRIGVNLGDILIEGDDILGDGVNIAAYTCGIILSAAPSCGKALTPRPPPGFSGASKPTAILRLLISCWQSSWHTSVSWARREWKHSPA